MYTLGIYCLSIGIKPTELYHRYPFMPPTSTEIYHVQITQFELYHVYPKLAPTGRYTRYNPLVSLYPVHTCFKPRQAKLSHGYQIPDVAPFFSSRAGLLK